MEIQVVEVQVTRKCDSSRSTYDLICLKMEWGENSDLQALKIKFVIKNKTWIVTLLERLCWHMEI